MLRASRRPADHPRSGCYVPAVVPGVPAPKIVKRPFEPAQTLDLVRRAAGDHGSGYRGVLAPIRTASDLYGPLLRELPLAPLETVAARTHGVGLARTRIGLHGFMAGLLVMGTFFGLPALWLTRPDAPWFAWVVAALFLLLGVLILFLGFQRAVSRLRRVSVDVDQALCFLGDEFVVRVSTPVSLADFQVRLRCVEAANVVVKGSPTPVTRERCSQAMHLVERGPGRGKSIVSTLTLRLPSEGPASFDDEECSVHWYVTVTASSGWLDERFRFHAVPRVGP
jgi:uncharacterized membrane protein (DUF2068 family)